MTVREQAFFGPDPTLGDQTIFQDDLGGLETGASSGNHYAQYGTFGIGGSPASYSAVAGTLVAYTSGNQTHEGTAQMINAATARTGAGGHGWLIHDNAGSEILYAGNPLTNPGSVAYQNACKTNLQNYLSSNPSVGGFFVDNFEMSVQNFASVSYPIKDQDNVVIWNNDADFQTAQIAFSANVHKAIKDAGKTIFPNARGFISGDIGSNNGQLTKDWMDRYHTYVTGMTVEFWNQYGNGTPPPTYVLETATSPWDSDYRHAWNEWMSVMAYAQAYGLGFYPVVAVDPAQTSYTRFLRASYLMNWNGTLGAIIFDRDFGDPWNVEMAKDVGQPLSAKVSVGPTGCWKRQYEHYLIYVNANPASQTLDGHTIASGDALWIAS